MNRKSLRLWLYNALLITVVGIVALCAPPWQETWPNGLVVALFVVVQWMVWHFGFPVPTMGMNSMERVPQVAAVLLFPLPVAMVINAIPALVWPFTNHRYRQGSWHYGAIRAVHNACMLFVITGIGGLAYTALGGPVPLMSIRWTEVDALLALAFVMQIVNSAMILAFFGVDGRDIRRLATWDYLWSDLLFVPLGILSALIYTNTDSVTMIMFVLLILFLVVTFHELSESRTKIAMRLDALDAASAARRGMTGSVRVDEVAERLFAEIGSLFKFEIAFVALYDREADELDVVIQTNKGVRLPRMRKPVTQGLSGHVVRTGKPVLIDHWDRAAEDLRAKAVIAPDEDPGSVLIVPMKIGERVVGILSVQDPRANYFSDTDKNALLALADDIAPVLSDAQTFQELDDYRLGLEQRVQERTQELERAGEERECLLTELRVKSETLAKQSREDALTGLGNRRWFEERLQEEIERARRYGHPLGFALLDIDHFKRINDSAGHAGGDAVLVRLACALRERLRLSDAIARIGGEEFAILFPETNAVHAVQKMELLRAAIVGTDFTDIDPGLQVTISAGVTEWLPDETRDVLLRRADVALYRCKAEGRNCVRLADLTKPG